MSKSNKLSKEDKVSIIRLVIIGALGLEISILFIFLYQKYNNSALTIITAVLSLAFMVGSLIIISKKELIFKNTTRAAILFPLCYIALIFAFLLFVEQKRIPDNPMRVLDCFLWAVYTMPAFIIVLAILLLVIIAIAYAN